MSRKNSKSNVKSAAHPSATPRRNAKRPPSKPTRDEANQQAVRIVAQHLAVMIQNMHRPAIAKAVSAKPSATCSDIEGSK